MPRPVHSRLRERASTDAARVNPQSNQETLMSNHVYKHLELTGSSTDGIEAAISNAIQKAHKTLRHLQWFEVTDTRGQIVDGKVAHWQVTLKVGFTLED